MTPEREISDSRRELPSFGVEKILVAGNRGPCGGVWRIFKIADLSLDQNAISARKYGVEPEPIYTNWNLVNNIPVTENYQKSGLHNFKNNWDLVPDFSQVIPSAHGVGPSFYENAKEKHCTVIAEGTCQLVTRVQMLARKAEKAGKFMFYIGVDGHPETIGVMAQVSPENSMLIAEGSAIRRISELADRPKIVLSQTTLSTDEVRDKYRDLKVAYPDIEIPSRWDICNATDTRQAAVKELAAKSQLLIIVGSGPSHNSTELMKIGLKYGIPSYLIDYPDQVQPSWFTSQVKVTGVSSGASVPDYLMQPVVDKVAELNPDAKTSEEEQVVDEDLAQVFKYQEDETRQTIEDHYMRKYAA